MCIIIDANVGNEFGPLTDDARCVYEWLIAGGRVATGGRLKTELLRTKFRNLYQPLLLAGRLLEYANNEVDRMEGELRQGNTCTSDDAHIIALARVSDSRTLFSRDVDLHADFCGRMLLRPRGRVYQNRSHQHLLRTARKCRDLQ
jgi:hypothetical protein